MTNQQHPITPPPELWKQFAAGAYTWKEAVTYAYRAGADQELEACCEWAAQFNYDDYRYQDELRAKRRPKPPSLKEQALEWCNDYIDPDGVIRRALEQLDD